MIYYLQKIFDYLQSVSRHNGLRVKLNAKKRGGNVFYSHDFLIFIIRYRRHF